MLFTCFAHTLWGQEGKIIIQQDQKIETLLALYKAQNAALEFYQIQFGFGTFKEAQELKNEVELDFPELKPKIEFKSPTYRVTGGKFRTKIEAERKFIEVRKKYKQALLPPKKTSE